MKAWMSLSVVQTVAIAVMAFFIFSDRNNAAPRTTLTNAVSTDYGLTDQSEIALARPSLDEDQLRRIVREELAAAMSAAPTQPVVAIKPSPDPIAAADQREHLERVTQMLENYKRRGSITSQEMQELQQDIAHLNDDDRALMSSSLVRALNSEAVKFDNQ